MGNRATVAIVEHLGDVPVTTAFYGHWVGNSILDIVAEALDSDNDKFLPAEIAYAFEEIYGRDYDITPYVISANHPVITVHRLGSEMKVYFNLGITDEANSDIPDDSWHKAMDFVEAVESTRFCKCASRFEHIEYLLSHMDGVTDCV